MLSASTESPYSFALGSTRTAPPPPRAIRERISSIRTSISDSQESTTPESINSQSAAQTSIPSSTTAYATSPQNDASPESPRRAHCFPNDNDHQTTNNIHSALHRRQACRAANRHDPLAIRPPQNLRSPSTISAPEPPIPTDSRSTKLSQSRPITHPRLRKYPPSPPTPTPATTNNDSPALHARTAKRQERRHKPYSQLNKVHKWPTVPMDEEQPPIRQDVREPSSFPSTPSLLEPVAARRTKKTTNVPVQIQVTSGEQKIASLLVLTRRGITDCENCIAISSTCPLSVGELNDKLDPHPPSISFTTHEGPARKRIIFNGKVHPRTTVGGGTHSKVDLSGVRVLDILARRDVILDGDKAIDIPDKEITVMLGGKTSRLRLQCYDCKTTVYGLAYAVSVFLHERIEARAIKGHIRNAFLVSLDLSATGVWEPRFSLY